MQCILAKTHSTHYSGKVNLLTVRNNYLHSLKKIEGVGCFIETQTCLSSIFIPGILETKPNQIWKKKYSYGF